MAFTEAERARIRELLGYPQLFRQAFYRLESALDLVGAEPETLAIAQGYITELIDIESSLTSSLATAGMKRAEDIEWYEGQSIITGRKQLGRTIINRLSNLLGVEILSDYFGSSGYQGDGWITRPPFLNGLY